MRPYAARFATSLLPLALALSLVLALSLTGCALNSTATSVSAVSPGVTIQGHLHGGQQPIIGAHVFLFAANTTGYGQPSVSLLKLTTGTTLDNTAGSATLGDYYVTTDMYGGFTITGDYSCAAGQQVYLYATSGDSGSGPNPKIGSMAVLGACPTGATNFLAEYPSVQINEVTTIAAAYAFAGYAVDATHVSSPANALARQGIANGFANAGNLVSLTTGITYASTPASVPGQYGQSNVGTVPQAEINTLGNVLSYCINSSPSTSTNCSTLLGDAMNGSTVPAETATAAINIAHNPGANVSALYGLVPASPPFAGGLSTAPNDWTIAVNYTAGLGYAGTGGLYSFAIDALGNVWTRGALTELTPTGVQVSPYYNAGYPNTTYNYNALTSTIAIDASGNHWVPVTNNTTAANSVIEYSPAGVNLSNLLTPAAGDPYSLAFDPTGNLWLTSGSPYTNAYPITVTELNSTTGANVGSSPYTVTSLAGDNRVAIDAGGNAWLSVFGSNTISAAEISSSGVLTTYSFPPTVTPGFPVPETNSVALDSAGNKWFPNSYCAGYDPPNSAQFPAITCYLDKVTGSGTGYALSDYVTYVNPVGEPSLGNVSVDGSGHVFVTTIGDGANNTSNWIGEFSNAGVSMTPANGFVDPTSTCQSTTGTAIDGSGNVWVSCLAPAIMMEYIGLATPVVTPLVANLLPPYSAPASKP